MKKNLLIVLSFLLVLSTGCKKSVEGELKAWDSNMKTLKTLKAEYPNFADAIDQTIKIATDAKAEADKITDEEAKIEALSKANSLASPRFVDNLESLDDKISDINDLKSTALQAATEESDKNAVKQAAADAEVAIKEAKEMLKSVQVSDIDVANTMTDKALKKLEVAEETLDNLVNKIEKKTKLAKQEQEKQKQKEEQAKQPIKCEYCGTLNDPGATKCKSCGAPLPQKNK